MSMPQPELKTRKMLDVSTRHVTEEDTKLLDAGDFPIYTVCQYEEGYFIYVGDVEFGVRFDEEGDVISQETFAAATEAALDAKQHKISCAVTVSYPHHDAAKQAGFSDAFIDLIYHAARHDCAYINLDRDGEEYPDELPEFDW